jgi:hypothetical protein
LSVANILGIKKQTVISVYSFENVVPSIVSAVESRSVHTENCISQDSTSKRGRGFSDVLLKEDCSLWHF